MKRTQNRHWFVLSSFALIGCRVSYDSAEVGDLNKIIV